GRDLGLLHARVRRGGLPARFSDPWRGSRRRGGRARVRPLPRAHATHRRHDGCASGFATPRVSAEDPRRRPRGGRRAAAWPRGGCEGGWMRATTPIPVLVITAALAAGCASTPNAPPPPPEPITPADLVASIADVAAGRNPAMAETGLILQ